MRVLVAVGAGFIVTCFGCTTSAPPVASDAAVPQAYMHGSATRYLAFQVFRDVTDSEEMAANFTPGGDLLTVVKDLRRRIGTTGSNTRKLGFILGPISFDTPDETVRATIRNVFDVILKTGVAGGLHIDDSMFWGTLKELDTIESIEWLDWNRTPNTGRRLDWSSRPTKIMPQLCLNSPRVRQVVALRAALIGNEVTRGLEQLHEAGKDDLFIGVIAGWEMQIGRDFDTGKQLGYCALTNAGFSAAHPPADRDRELAKIVNQFAAFWADSLVNAGVPRGKVYTHIAFVSHVMYQVASRVSPQIAALPYLELINYTPPDVAFCAQCVPGFSTYPQPGQLEQLSTTLAQHGDPAWASSEGTAIDPSVAFRNGQGMDMETYLGNLFNHGARLVNVYFWDSGPLNNTFRRTTESEAALAAYRKFLHDEKLREAAIPIPSIPPADLPAKIRRIQALLPGWVGTHGPAQVQPLMQRLADFLQHGQYQEASKNADEMLRLMRSAQ